MYYWVSSVLKLDSSSLPSHLFAVSFPSKHLIFGCRLILSLPLPTSLCVSLLLTVTPIVVISELMWMGDFSSPRHEWIELYNTTDLSKIKTGSSDVDDPNQYSGIGLFF